MIKGDHVSLNLVFSNLFQNAIKYAGENTELNIAFTTEKKKLKITIADNGPGVMDKEKSKIFSKFYRIGDENTRQTKGTGLGLFLVKQILWYTMQKSVLKTTYPKAQNLLSHLKQHNYYE